MNNELAVVWVTKDADAAMNMILMYTKNSMLKHWWDRVQLIVWGPSAELLAHDEKLQAEVKAAAAAGVELLACKACADRYGVSADLTNLGIEVKYMGEPLTELLKSGWHVLSV